MKFSIVDIETTGGSAKTNGITEIAIIRIEDGKEIDRYETLINPNMLIPHKITMLTGITNEMVEDAPAFHEVAQAIWDRTHDHVFVAHNVNFDYSFIREQFALLGFQWRPKRLCTVRLSRKLIPNLYSYSLGKIADQLGYSINARHRAMGDCDFTATLFLRLLERDEEGHIAFSLNLRSREATLPPHLKRERFDKIPSTQGVYIFKGPGGKVIYVGKANNLKDRVADHFRGNTHTGLKNRFSEKIEDLEWIECPNEMIALLTEANQIKKHWPPYNRLMKRVTLNWGIYTYTDQRGYHRFNIGRVGKWDRPVFSFKSSFEAKTRLEFLCTKYDLCAKYCGLQEHGEACLPDYYGSCNKACEGEESAELYNQRVQYAMAELMQLGKTMLIKGKGFNENESSVVLLEGGRYKGHGLVPNSVDLTRINDVKNWIDTGYDDQDIQAVILSQLSKKSTEAQVLIID